MHRNFSAVPIREATNSGTSESKDKYSFSSHTDWTVAVHEDLEQSIGYPHFSSGKDYPIEINDLKKSILEGIEKNTNSGNSFIVSFRNYRFRVQMVNSNKYHARAIGSPPLFNTLNIPKVYQRLLINGNLRNEGGLVIISGRSGSGKTSTAAACIIESLKSHGGYALTVEDPPEYLMEGRHGEFGVCLNIDANVTGFADAIFNSLRAFPVGTKCIILISEVRSIETALELLKVAIKGHLVYTTIHAENIESAVAGLIAYSDKGREQLTRFLLASCLKLVIHQTLADSVLTLDALEVDRSVASIIQNSEHLNLVDSIRKTRKMIDDFS